MTYGHVEYNHQVLDEVMAVFMKAPKTYTREDVAEIHCHGGYVSGERILNALIDLGLRPAEPGEFTKRAFLNGRLDLSAAGAVMEIITAKTQKAHQAAMNRQMGALGRFVGGIRQNILGLLAHIEADIDFAGEDLVSLDTDKLLNVIDESLSAIQSLENNYDQGRLLQEGADVAIVGRPNVGKSSILNWLLDSERAIVSPEPGTTRDLVTDTINLGGLAVKLTDTAGIRQTDNTIEGIGVRKSIENAKEADMLVAVFDGSEPLTQQDLDILKLKPERTLAIINKSDKATVIDLNLCGLIPKERIIQVSAMANRGKETLLTGIRNMLINDSAIDDAPVMISNARNHHSVKNAIDALGCARNTVCDNLPGDLVAIDLRDACFFLGEITGESVDEDLVNKIFAEFCVGK